MARAFLAASNHAAARREAESALAADPDDMTMFLAFDVIADVCWERDNWPAVIDIGERMLKSTRKARSASSSSVVGS